MIGLGVVEIDHALDEPQAEGAGVEIEVARRLAGDGRDMVQAGHGGLLFL
jgi:hypothetical protein